MLSITTGCSQSTEYATQDLCQLSKYSKAVVEADVIGTAGSRLVPVSLTEWEQSSELQLSVVKTYRGTVPSTIKVYGWQMDPTTGEADIGPISSVNGAPRRGLFFLAGGGSDPWFIQLHQGYFWPDAASVLRNKGAYSKGLPRADVEAAIAQYATWAQDGKLCPAEVPHGPWNTASNTAPASPPQTGSGLYPDGGP